MTDGYKIAFTENDLDSYTLTSLGIPDPKSQYRPFAEQIALGSAGVRGAGWPILVWTWGYLTMAQRDALRAFCGTASNEVYLETRTFDNSDVFDRFRAIMVWPAEEDRIAHRRLNFQVQFIRAIRLETLS